MITRLSRIFLVILTIFVGAVYLPQLYWVSFEPRIIPPMVFYSPVIQKFMIGHFGHGKYYFTDEDGHKYNRLQADHLLPLLNFRILAARDEMPDSLLGRPISLNEVHRNNVSIRITPKDVNPPQIPLYPLFESKPQRLRLGLPDEYFRLTDRMEFINAKTNQINDSLTKIFTQALLKAGFHFPARKVFGNPTTRKPYDAGYFIVDHDWQLFHLKKIHGKPYCKNVPIPENVKINWISVKEKELREFCGIAITENNKLYMVMLNPERLQKLPVSDYNREQDHIIFMGNLFYRFITIRSEGHLTTYLTDRNYKLLKTYKEKWPTRYETTAGVLSAFIFPFELNLQSGKTYFINFNFSSFSWKALYLNVILVLAAILFLIKRKFVTRRWFDLVLILITGIYGFIGVLLFEQIE